MEEIKQNDLCKVNAGGVDIKLDINELIRQLNPYEIGKEFGKTVVYPYIWVPIKNMFNK